MKYFKQTKGTKRKTSLLMVLAMVISLLPAQPVVKAAEETAGKTITVTNNIEGLEGTNQSITLEFTDSKGTPLDLSDNSAKQAGSQTVTVTEDSVNLKIKAPDGYIFYYDTTSIDGDGTDNFGMFNENIPKIETNPSVDVSFDTKAGRLQEYNVKIPVKEDMSLTLSGNVEQDNEYRMLNIDLTDFELISKDGSNDSAISIMVNNNRYTSSSGSYSVDGSFKEDKKCRIFPNIAGNKNSQSHLKEGDKITISIGGNGSLSDNTEYALVDTPVVTNTNTGEKINATGPRDSGAKVLYITDKITIHGNMTLKISNSDIVSPMGHISINNNLENASCNATYDTNYFNKISQPLEDNGSSIQFKNRVVSGSSVIFNVKPSDGYTFVKDTENIPKVTTTLDSKEENVTGTLNDDGSYTFNFTFKCGMSVDISGTAQPYNDLSFDASGLTGAGYTVSGDYLKDSSGKLTNVTIPSSDTKTPKELQAAIGSTVNLLINADDKKVFGSIPVVIAKDSSGNVLSDANITVQEADGQTDKTSYKCAITVTDKISSIEITGTAEIQKRTVTFSKDKLVNAGYRVSGDGILEGETIVNEDRVFENPDKLTVAQGAGINIEVIPDEGYGFIAGSPVVKSGDADIESDENGLYSAKIAENTSITVSGTAINTYDVDFTSNLNGAGFDVIYTDGNGTKQTVTTPSAIKVKRGQESITLTINPDENHRFIDEKPVVKVDGTKATAVTNAENDSYTYIINITKDTAIEVSATANEAYYTEVIPALTGAKCTVTYNSAKFSSGYIKKGESVHFEIEPEENHIFKELPEVMVNGEEYKWASALTPQRYTFDIKVKEATEVSISGTAWEKYEISYLNSISEDLADVEVSVNEGSGFNTAYFPASLTAVDEVKVVITPKTGYFYDNTSLGNIIEAEGADISEELSGNVYTAVITKFTKGLQIRVSGAPEERKVIDVTDISQNVGNANLDISKDELEEHKEVLIDSFKNDPDAGTEIAKEVAEAVSNGGIIKLKLEVATGSAITESAINAINKAPEDEKIGTVNEIKEKGVNLDIRLIAECYKAGEDSPLASTEVKDFGTRKIKITISLSGEAFENVPKDGTVDYYIIRIHDNIAKRLSCATSSSSISGEVKSVSFESEVFSTYIFMYEDKPAPTETPDNPNVTDDPNATKDPNATDDPNATNDPNATSTPGTTSTTRPVYPGPGGNSYIPPVTSSPAPSASTTPGVTPGATQLPGTAGTAIPTETPGTPGIPGTSNTETPAPGNTKAPAGTNKPGTDDSGKDDNIVPVIKIGKKVTVNSGKYKVTSVKGTRTVQFINGKKNVKNIVIPATIKVSSKKYKVTSIAPNAFKNNKKLKKVVIGVNIKSIGKNAFKGCKNLKRIIIKTKKLTAKRTGANAFKGINKKAVIKVPAKKLKAYKKIIKAKGAGRNVKIKK